MIDLAKLSTPITNKVADFCGYDLDYSARKDEAEQIKVNYSTGGAANLADYLAYDYFDNKQGVFFLEEGVAAFMLEISPLVGIDKNVIKTFDSLLAEEIPEDGHLQFLLVGTNEVDHILKDWQESSSTHHPILQKINQKRVEFIKRQSQNYAEYDGRFPRDYRIYINFSKQGKITDASIKKMVQFRKKLVTKLKIIKIHSVICDEESLIRIIRQILEYSGTDVEGKSYNKLGKLSEQVLSPSMRYEITEKGIHNSKTGFVSRCYYPIEYPEVFGLNSMISLLGDNEQQNLGLSSRFIISYSLSNTINKIKQDTIIARGNKAIKSAESWLSRNDTEAKRDASEWLDIIDKYKNKKARFLHESFQVLISGPEDNIDELEEQLIGLYRCNDWQLMSDNKFHLPAMLSMLPMQQPLYHRMMINCKLKRTVLNQEAVCKLPIHAEWKGVPEPGLLLQSTRGQLFNWNPFYRISSGNYNMALIAASGSGKSFLLQALTTMITDQGGRVFILDIGRSFGELTKMLGGEILEFGKKVQFAINPFAGFKLGMDDDMFKDMIKCSKALMLTMLGKKDEGTVSSKIEKLIGHAVRKYHYHLDIKSFVTELENSQDAELNECAIMLYSYTSEGIYGKYFNNSNSATFKKNVTVFEFEEIKNDPKLIAIILQTLLMEITGQFFTGDRQTRFMIIVDEAWMLLDYSAGFFSNFARTVRKYGGGLATCVQNIDDFLKTDERKSILANSTWTILPKQDEKGVEGFSKLDAFQDMIPLIKSVQMVPGKYAEFLISATGIKTVARLALDEYSSTLYSTDAKDFAFLQQAEKTGIGMDEAIEKLVERKYGQQ